MLFSCKLCNIPNNLTARSKPPPKGEEGRASAWRRGLRYAESNLKCTKAIRTTQAPSAPERGAAAAAAEGCGKRLRFCQGLGEFVQSKTNILRIRLKFYKTVGAYRKTPQSGPLGLPAPLSGALGKRKFQLFKNCCILFWGNVLYFPRSVRVGRPGLPLGADISPAFYRENAGVFRKEGDSGPDFLRSAACFLRSFCGAPAPTLSLLMFLLKGDFNIWQKN